MLDLEPNVIDYARKVANKVNQKYWDEGGDNSKRYTNLYSVLQEMIDLQIENEDWNGFEENPFNPSVFGRYSKFIRLGNLDEYHQ